MRITWWMAVCAAGILIAACESDEEGGGGGTTDAGGDAAGGDTGGTDTGTTGDTTVADTGGDMGGGEADWSCLGNVVFPPPTESTVTVTANVVAFGTEEPAVDVAFAVCNFADTNCDSPIYEGMTDQNGTATFDVPTGDVGFDGYTEVTTSATFFPTLGFINPPIVEDVTLNTALFQNAVIDLFAQALGVTLDSSRGHVALLIDDCAGNAAAGVSVDVGSADGSSTVGYTTGGAPNPAATETSADGAVGVFNVPEGPAVITATNADGDEVAVFGLFVVAGAISATVIVPN